MAAASAVIISGTMFPTQAAMFAALFRCSFYKLVLLLPPN